MLWKAPVVLLLGLLCLAQGKFYYEIEYEKEFQILEKFNGSLELALASLGVKEFKSSAEFIEMRDGVSLYTAISVPLFGRNVGCVLVRTSYTTLYAPALAIRWLPQGFAVALQDQRGTGISRGDNFGFWRYDGPDGYDTMEYLTAQTWSNENVFLTGTSSMGNAVIAGLLLYPPWVKAFSPIVFTGNGHPTTYQGGAFRQGLVGNWLTVLGFIFTLQEVKENEAYSQWWDPITITGKEDRCAMQAAASGGWYDIFLNETIDGFNACQYRSPTRGQHKLVIVPGGHCTGGDYAWPNSRTSIHSDLTLALFLEHNGDNVPRDLAERVAETDAITLYIMGPENPKVGGYWTTIPTWPEVTETVFYLQPDRTLDRSPSSSANSSVTYTYDPDSPVRTNGGNEMFLPCGPRLQDAADARQDVIVFVSDPFTSVTPIVGNVTAVLYVSTDAVDTDFTVKISDQYPNGRAYNLVDGVIRLRWRDSLEVPTPAVPGEVYEVHIDLWKTAYVFNEGHSVRVDISSSNHPRFEKNPNNGLPITETGRSVVARNTVFFDRGHPSRVILPVVDIADIPDNFTP
jgi:predicted acyl esterase